MAPRSINEAHRLRVLRGLDLGNTQQQQLFDDITALAAQLTAAPIALVSLIEEDFQWFKAKVGLQCERTGRDISFCDHAIQQHDLTQPFVVPDATTDPRFCQNPSVTGPMRLRMYAGVPLVTEDGYALGALCVIDTKPRQPTPEQLSALRTLARNVMTLIESQRHAASLRVSEARNRTIVDATFDAVLTLDRNDYVLDWNGQAAKMFGTLLSRGVMLADLIARESGNATVVNDLRSHRLASAGRRQQFELVMQRDGGQDFLAELSIVATPTAQGLMRTAFVRDISRRHRQEMERRETETRDIVIFALARLAESRDPETGSHIERVQHYSRVLAERLRQGIYADEMDEDFVRLIYSTSPLHDIGKVGIPDHVLLKPGKLTSDEFEVMTRHAQIGADTLGAAMAKFPDTRFLRMARNIAATHHERYDGTGYPKGLRGEQIPLCGRIVALADVYDALTSRRVYKAPMSHTAAREIIAAEAGRHFDPNVVNAFLSAEYKFAVIRMEHAEPMPVAATHQSAGHFAA